jgi:uncharacterized protein
MFLRVKDMELQKVCFDETLPAGRIDFAGEALSQRTPLHAEGAAELLENTDGEVRIEGRYRVEMESECDRCLGLARFPLDARFDLFYRPMSDIARSEEIEIHEGDTEIGFYEGDGIELADVLREQILLALPIKRVCGEECRGICPACGADRNQTACECAAAPVDDRWGALRDLK